MPLPLPTYQRAMAALQEIKAGLGYAVAPALPLQSSSSRLDASAVSSVPAASEHPPAQQTFDGCVVNEEDAEYDLACLKALADDEEEAEYERACLQALELFEAGNQQAS